MPSAGRDIIVIGCSTGGIEVMMRLVGGLPAGLPASVFVVCHIPPGARSVLPEILSRRGRLLAAHARDGEPFYPGQIYVAPPDYHLMIEDGRTRLSHGPRQNMFRPAIDPLFRSAARAHRSRVIGVVLTGGMSDGVAGLMAVRAGGGVAIIQDPEDAAVGVLPENASRIAGADYIVPAERIGPLLVELVQNGVKLKAEGAAVDPIEKMPEVVDADMQAQENGDRRGQTSVYSCPECGGVLWQVDDAGLARFRCHVGHIYVGDALLSDQAGALEAALWTAARIFRERTVLLRQLAAHEQRCGSSEAAERFRENAREAERHGQLIVELLTGKKEPPSETGPASS